MKILVDVHGWPPDLPAGAERMLQSICTWLAKRGHEIKIIATAGPRPETHEERDAEGLYDWADLVITHLDRTSRVMRMSARADKRHLPIVHVVHNPDQLDFHNVTPDRAGLIVWNAENTKKQADRAHGIWTGRQIIVRPPVWPDEYLTDHRGPTEGFVTLVNLNENKGGRLLDRMARMAPGMKFLGVRGGYARQYLSKAPNVRNVDSQDDMRAIYRETAILIIPSASETYGRVGIEAAISGIPVVASDLPGIREAMGSGALYVPDRVAGIWLRRIRQVLDDYGTWSQRALDRARELDPEPELMVLEAELEALIDRRSTRVSAQTRQRQLDRSGAARGNDGEDPKLDDRPAPVPSEDRRRARPGARPRADAKPGSGKAGEAHASKPPSDPAREQASGEDGGGRVAGV